MMRPFTDDPDWMAGPQRLDLRPTRQVSRPRRAGENIPTAFDVAVVTDGSALSAAYAGTPADLVLIGL